MTSERKISANRQNAKKSTGPKTRSGKGRASRNALRHGLGRTDLIGMGSPANIVRMAKAICNDSANSAQYEQALIIAECNILLSRIRTARIKAIERYRSRSESKPVFPEVRGAMRMWEIAQASGPEIRGDLELLVQTLPEIFAIERYERRALSRRRRAIRTLDAMRE